MKIWLAPLHGITYFPFRNLFLKHFAGVDALITPFVPVISKEQWSKKTWKDLFPENNQIKSEVIPQIIGGFTSDYLFTIRKINELGYLRINWNLGCPMPQITRKNRGCGMLPFSEKIEKIVENIITNTSCRLSLKIRMGLHSREEARDLLQRMNAYPLDFVCIHPRLGDWQYQGIPDLEEFNHLLSICRHKMIYNGDIFSYSIFKDLQENFPVIQEWMFGRGLLMNPFLAEEIKGTTISQEEQQQRFIRFHRHLLKLLIELKGEKTALAALKELWHYFSVFWNLDENALKKILRSQNLNEFLQQISGQNH